MDDRVREQLLAFVEGTVDFVGVCDGDGRVVYLNEAARKRLGVGDPHDLTTANLFPPEAFARYYDEVRPELLQSGRWDGTMPVLRASGESVPMLMSAVASVSAGGAIMGLVTFARDLPVAAALLGAAHPAQGDGGPSLEISELHHRVRAALVTSAAHDERVAVLRAAVGGIGDINRTFGSDIGDNVLRVLAYRMTQAVRATDTVARIGGDEFAVWFCPVRDAGEALRLAEGVRDAMEQMPVVTAAGDMSVTVAIGVAVGVPSDGVDTLLERAAGLRAVRAVDRGVATDSRRTPRSDPATSVRDLHLAISHGEIEACVQPVVDLRTGHIVGYEGLARWPRRDASVVDAETLAASVAGTPLAPVIDLRVAREAATVVTVMSRGPELRLYTRVSEPLLVDVRLEQYLWEIVEAFGLPTRRMYLQVEEPDVVSAPHPNVERLVDLGARLVATGVASDSDVARLARLGVYGVQLSRGATPRSRSDSHILAGLRDAIRLAHDLGLEVGVVGVDDERQAATWRAAGCDVASGTLFGRPVRADSVD